MSILLMFPPKVHFNDDNEAPLDGGKVFTYKAGEVTLIPKDTYTDKAKSGTHTNPIILDARGEAEVWLDGEYKIIVKDKNDVEVYTVDNVSTEAAGSALSEWLVTGDTPTFISATQFSVPADLTAIYHEGRRVKLTVTAGTVYGVIKTVAYTTLTTVTVVLDSGALDSGLSVVDVGLLSAVEQAYPIQQIQYGGYAYVPDTGAADAYVAVMVPPLYDYKTGFVCKVLMANANTVINPTININGLGAKVIKNQIGAALIANDIEASQIVDLIYDGTDFRLLNRSGVNEHAHTDAASGGIIAYPLYGDGADGVYSSGATGNLAGDIGNFTTYAINDTHVMTINTGNGLIIVADTSITIAGTLDASGLGGAGGTDVPSGAAEEGLSASGGGGGGSDVVSSTAGDSGGDSVYNGLTIAGGAGGSTPNGNGSVGSPQTVLNLRPSFFEGRYGAGGGAGGGTGDGGAGGNGGGFIVLIAPTVTIEATATLNVSGGAGVNGTSGDGDGAGGGGGEILIVSHNYTDNGGTFTLDGGVGATGGTAGEGAAGGVGIKRVVIL